MFATTDCREAKCSIFAVSLKGEWVSKEWKFDCLSVRLFVNYRCKSNRLVRSAVRKYVNSIAYLSPTSLRTIRLFGGGQTGRQTNRHIQLFTETHRILPVKRVIASATTAFEASHMFGHSFIILLEFLGEGVLDEIDFLVQLVDLFGDNRRAAERLRKRFLLWRSIAIIVIWDVLFFFSFAGIVRCIMEECVGLLITATRL